MSGTTNSSTDGARPRTPAYSVRGWYRLLWELNIPVDFVEASQLDEAFIRRLPGAHPALPLSMSEEVAGKLARYVEAGGKPDQRGRAGPH